MAWNYYLAYFFGGAFFANALPHFISGTMGRAFQSPFASPPGEGLSSSTINVLWGAFNFVIAYLLICQVGNFELRNVTQVTTFGLGALVLGLLTGYRFGRFNGGNTPSQSDQA